MFFSMFVILFAPSFNYRPTLASRTNFQVRRFELCNNTQGLFKFHANITKENDNYFLGGYALITKELDDNIGFSWKIESKVSKTYVEVFTIREKNFCKAANMYLGEMWYDLQRAAQVIPGKCPMPPKRYETHHALLDFKKISLQTFPFGMLRFTGGAIDNKYPENNLLCLVMEVENIFN